METPILELKNISKKGYLSNISFSAKANSITAILGKSKSSKTLLLNAIINLIKYEGKIFFMGHDIKKGFSKNMSFIGYSSSLVYKKKNITVKEYLDYSNSFYKANYSSNIDEYISYFNLNKDSKLIDLDRNDAKLASLINAIFFEPKLIIIDDLYKDLDNNSSFLVKSLLLKLKNKGCAILYTSDSLHNIEITDDIIVISQGTIKNYNDDITKYLHVDLKFNKGSKKLNNDHFYNLKSESNIMSFITDLNENDLMHILDDLDISYINITSPDLKEIEQYYESKANS